MKTIMVYDYTFADLNFRLISDNEIIQNGFAPVFKSNFASPDVTLFLKRGDVPQSTVPVFHSNTVGVDENGAVLIYDLGTEQNGLLIQKEAVPGEYTVIYNNEKYLEGRYLFGLMDLQGILTCFDRVMFHSSFILYKGRAVLFSGKSGIGKSTQANLWRQFAGAEIINGDKAVLYIKDGVPYVSSLPVAGTSGICKNTSVPLGAVVFLAQGKVNTVTVLSRFDAVIAGLKNCIIDIWRSGETDCCLDLLAKIFDKAPAFSFTCLKDESAVDVLKNVLEQKL